MTLKAPYKAAHLRAKYRYGPPAYHECDFCGITADHWALDWSARDIKRDREGRAYTDDPEDMFPACQRCHRIYDKARKGLSEVGLIQLRGQLWESIPDEVRAAHQKSLQHKRAAYLRYKYKVDEVVDRRVRVMGNE